MSISDDQRNVLVAHRLDCAREALEDAKVLRQRIFWPTISHESCIKTPSISL